MKKKLLINALTIILAITVVGCSFISIEDIQESIEVIGINTPQIIDEEDEFEGLEINPLTGLLIDEELILQRPIAVVINNIPKALPQSGIRQADIYYEVLAEGGITRIIGIFKDFDSEKIGPIRSTRDYFVNFALDHNAVLVHHGGSTEGYNAISRNGVNNLDGMILEGTSFWRDPVRVRQSGMREHSSYTSKENIFAAAESRGFEMSLEEPVSGPFRFYEEPQAPKDSTEILSITVPFSHSQSSKFIYDEVEKVFRRYQNNRPHIDEETGEQIKVKNIIVQKVNKSIIPGDEAGRIKVDLVGEGDGYLITQGAYVPIRWRKSSAQSPTQWFDINGDKLQVNKGQTWICVFQKNDSVIFEKEEVEENEEELTINLGV